jgi:hypothetical protein
MQASFFSFSGVMMASEPMLPHFFWIQEQDAVIRIIPIS